MIKYIVPELHKNGGIQEYAKSVYSELKDKFDMDILNWENDLNLPVKGILRYSPIKISNFLYQYIFLTHFRKKYKLNGTDLIHFWHTEPAMAFLDKKYVVTCHGMEILPSNVKSFRKKMYPEVFKKAKFICADSDYTKMLVKKYDVDERKIKVIHPPINFAKFTEVKKKINSDVIIIGTLTRFNRRKNVPNIIKALNILKEKYKIDFVYYLAGGGGLKDEKKRIFSELSKARFQYKYFGEITEEKKIKEFYPSLDVFVMPPLYLPNDVEGFGIVYLEANAYGIPVVASKTGGVPDAVKEGVSGEFTNPKNPEDIAMKILEVLGDKEKYSESARNWAKQFDIKRQAKRFVEMYTEANKDD